MYRNGVGTYPFAEKAVKHFRMAVLVRHENTQDANIGYAEAMELEARAYLDGVKVERDIHVAISKYEKVANQVSGAWHW